MPEFDIIGAVGKLHLGAHILECFWKFSLNFILGAGQVDGEVLETLWSELDKVAGFVRGMSVSHRQEVLDDMMMDSNWKKLVAMPQFLTAKLDHARTGLMETKEAFESLSQSVGQESVDTPSFWLVLETGPFASYTSLSLIMYF